MSTVSLSGNDTVVIAGISFVDVADGDFFTFTYNADLVTVKRGKNGNTIYAENAMGLMVEATLRLIRGSADDKNLESLLSQQLQSFAQFVLMPGQFVKIVGDGNGNLTYDTYNFTGGVFQRGIDAKSNADGDSEQSVSVYRFVFGDTQRAQL